MTNIIERIQSGEFANTKPYFSMKADPEGHKIYEEEDTRIYNAFRDACIQFAQEEISTSINEEQGKILFEYAWREGHSDGLQRVYYSLYNLVERLNKFNRAATD